MVSAKRPYGRRLLLPAEVELCQLLGLSEDEYWYFQDTVEAYNGKRPEGYELIPDIQAASVAMVLGYKTVTAMVVHIGIAVGLSVLSYLLAEKPKEAKSGGSRRTADAVGNSKFAPQNSFNSVQELAVIGDSIPLIFANAHKVDGEDRIYGGVRVNSQLLWSQLVSLGKYQQLKALALFSYGELAANPAYEGFAIGDSLINTYNAHKVGLYFKNGSISDDNRIIEGDRNIKSKLVYSEQDSDEPFLVGVSPQRIEGVVQSTNLKLSKAFSGARNPTTQTSFGVYSPLPNCQICRLPYELVRDPRGSEKESIRDLMRKRKKVEFAKWPTRAGIIDVNRNGTPQPKTTTAPIDGLVGDIVRYQLVGIDKSGEANALQRVYDNDPNTPEYQEDPSGDAFNYRPHGVGDVDSLTKSIRSRADNAIEVGEQYLIGTALAICTSNDGNAVPWSVQTGKSYEFEIIEDGKIDIPVDNADLAIHCNNPQWYDPTQLGFKEGTNKTTDALYSLNDDRPIFWQQIISGTEFRYPRGANDLYYGWDIYTVQRIALATVSNNRRCDVTEIGLKSTVYKRMRFANVNTQPDEASLAKAWQDRTTIQLGQVESYVNRISFFMLQARKIGEPDWVDLKNTEVTDHSGLFAVKGNTPEAQYNSITISHRRDQYEFRFKPFPGNYVTRGSNFGKAYNLLRTDAGGNGAVYHFTSGEFDVAFSGDSAYRIDREIASNPEWVLGGSSFSTTGKVTDATHNGNKKWVENSSFDGGITFLAWQRPFQNPSEGHAVYTSGDGYAIVLWNEISAPGWSAGEKLAGKPGYQWSLYTPSGEVVVGQADGAPNLNSAWNVIYFEFPATNGSPARRFVPGNPALYNHIPDANNPNGNNHKFWVEELRQEEKQDQVPQEVHFGPASVATTTVTGVGTGLKVILTVKKWKYEISPDKYYYEADWEVDPDPANLGNGYSNGDVVIIPWTDVDGVAQTIRVSLIVQVGTTSTLAKQNFNPFDVVADWNVYEGDENSNTSKPEHEIVYVNEILKPEVNNDSEETGFAKYSNLAFAGIRINSSKEWTNFSQFSAYFKEGIKIYDLINSSIDNNDVITWAADASSNLFPEIAYSLLASTKIGAGKLVGVDSIDFRAMKNAADFCLKNRFFWDGTISSKVNLREFIFEHAGYCLLDFTIIGGRFSLKPSLPVNGDNEIDKTVLPEIKCLFTDGNINDLEVSFLSPEERQTFKAVVLYREEQENGFSEKKSILVQENILNSETDPIETFDLSGFCTSRRQAKYFAFLAIRSRRLVDHGLKFNTAPQYVRNLSPGDYFRLVSEVTHTNRFKNGAKLEDGTIVSKDNMTGNEEVYYWEPGTEGIKPVDNGTVTLSQVPNGSLFTVKTTTTENKVYKCESISYTEDGLIEVAGSFAPTEPSKLPNGNSNPVAGQLSVMQNWGSNQDDPSSFTVSSDS